MRIGTKLMVIGALVLALPLATVSYFAMTEATAGLQRMNDDKLSSAAQDLAQLIDKVYEEETKLAYAIAANPSVVDGMTVIADKGRTSSAAARELDTLLAPFKTSTVLNSDYETVNLIGLDGVVVACSDPAAVGRSLAKRDYVKMALADQANVGAPVLSSVSKKPITHAAVPIKAGSRVVGAATLSFNLEFLNKIIARQKPGSRGFAFVVDSTGLMMAHPEQEQVFKTNLLQVPVLAALGKDMVAGKTGVDHFVLKGSAMTGAFAPTKTTDWSVAFVIPNSEYMASVNQVQKVVLAIALGGLIASLCIYLFFSRSITNTLGTGVSFAESIADGDLTQQLRVRQRDEVGKLAAALNGMTGRLNGMVGTIQHNAEQVAASSEEMSASAQSLAEGAQAQASALEETSASVEELSASVELVSQHALAQAAAVKQGSVSMEQVQLSIEEVSRSLGQISQLAHTSVEKSIEGAEAVVEVVQGITLIAESSERIGGIVNVISDIADQTNLLALNASIEAARAGEHGRGFAVVADEVSKLADRSSVSTKEIEGLIRDSVKNVRKGVEIAGGSKAAMEQIRTSSEKVQGMIEELSRSIRLQVETTRELAKTLNNVSQMSQGISAATEEQTSNTHQVSKAVENVNELTQAAASSAEQMSASTVELAKMAQQLQRLTSQFKILEEKVRASTDRAQIR